MKDENGQRRQRVRSRALALGVLVLFVYVGFIAIVALSNPSSVG